MVFGVLLATGASLTASLLLVDVAVLPLLFKYSKYLQRKIVFSNCINYPRHLDYEDPSSSNLTGARNCSVQFYSHTDQCPIKLGIWHMVPNSMFKDVQPETENEDTDVKYRNALMNNKNIIVLYCHGNSNHRASPNRLMLYQLLQQLGSHVVTYDYRGYGDSSKVDPTEQGVVEDCFQVYKWLLNNTSQDKPTVILWGHSLGSSIAANLVYSMSRLCSQYGCKELPLPDGIVLESPFNNMKDEVVAHPFSKLVSWLPYYEDAIVRPLSGGSDAFATDAYLRATPQLPALVLHAKHDRVIPHQLACKLYEAIRASRSEGGAPLAFHTFDDEHIGHNNIYEALELPHIIWIFVSSIQPKVQ